MGLGNQALMAATAAAASPSRYCVHLPLESGVFINGSRIDHSAGSSASWPHARPRVVLEGVNGTCRRRSSPSTYSSSKKTTATTRAPSPSPSPSNDITLRCQYRSRGSNLISLSLLVGFASSNNCSRRLVGKSQAHCPGVRCASAAAPAPQPALTEEREEVEEIGDGGWTDLTQVCAVLGSQWGDEGKGKLVDILAQRYDVVARCQGGSNAGHTIYNTEGTKFALHLVPSGILHPDATCVVGNGVVLYLPGFFKEIDDLEAQGVSCSGSRLRVSDRAHLLFDFHQQVDGLREAELAGEMIGTTRRGIGPCYASKAIRNGIRVADLRHLDSFRLKLELLLKEAAVRFSGFEYSEQLLDEEMERYKVFAKRLEPYVTDTVHFVNESYVNNKKILIEGANATMLDIDFGTYPFVTSSNPSIGGISTGLGLAPSKIGSIIGVAKAYTTRVGAGPYPTELFGEEGDSLRAAGNEYGTTTGRPRRCGWLDIVALKYASVINGFTSLNLTKLDVLTGLPELRLGVAYKSPGEEGEVLPSFPGDLELLDGVEVVYEVLPGWQADISRARKYEDLPAAARTYVERIEELVGVPIKYIGVGPGREDLIMKH